MADPALQYLKEEAKKLGSETLAKAALHLEAMDEEELELEGPALMPSGQVVDLDGDLAMHFSHDKDLSPSAASKEEAKERFRLMRAAKVAHAACEAEDRVDAGLVCSIGTDGMLHGSDTIVPPSPEMKAAGAERLKMIHGKRNRRADNQEDRVKEWAADAEEAILRERWEDQEDDSGELIPYSLDGDCGNLRRQVSVGSDGVVHAFERQVSIDEEGLVHDADAIRSPSAKERSRMGDRLKLCHRKRAQDSGKGVLCVDDSGTVQSRMDPCRIDPDGVIRNASGICPPSPEHKSSRAEQAKLFHRKRVQRSDSVGEQEGSTVVSVDSNGNVQSRETVHVAPLIMPAAVCAF